MIQAFSLIFNSFNIAIPCGDMYRKINLLSKKHALYLNIIELI
jgi:hypothetical protein